MNFFKVLGWVFIPYIMLLFNWKRLNTASRMAALVYSVVIIWISATANNQPTDESSTTASETVSEQTATLVTNETTKTEEQKAEEEATKKATEDEAKKKEEEELKKQHQEMVLKFEQDMYALEATKQAVMDDYTATMTALSTGEADIYTTYEKTTIARQAAEDLQLEFVSVDVPDSLPKEVKDLLNESKQEMSTAYYTKKQALDAVLRFLDDQKPSDLQTFKDEIQMADNFILSSVAKVLDAKTKVGIDITKE